MSDNSESQFEGLSSLVRLTGANVPARARFVGETVLVSTLSSLTLGLVCGQMGSFWVLDSVGPLVPYLVGSWVGYSMGMLNQWRTSKRLALSYAKKYPTLMAYALRQEWDVKVGSTKNLDRWIQNGGLGIMTMSILAAQSCRADVEEIQQKNRQRLVEVYGDGGERSPEEE
eukprot:CAMPEP_0116865200 /NCGR_PEP_ID=MMETSP0418-20121206/25265_1 /TAXON_ID=1158023 /ORGANISM="Astrosyne radiata, Strain 13vi08-1A" /LENGTH=170 /DNA_ID=CAMNT_0004500545 /DNA_START=184 /DNA_END=696 /DNA_ORIENTATION=-